MTAIGIILFAKVMVQATLFTEYLNEHDSKEEKPNSDSLPSTQPQGEAYKINERSRQHGIAIQTIDFWWNTDRTCRRCSVCGKLMREGYCVDMGAAYYCSDECLHAECSDEEWTEECENNDQRYYTEW